MSWKIITNNHWRTFLSWSELTPKEQEDFDYIKDPENEDTNFMRYRGIVYDLGEIMKVPETKEGEQTGMLRGWHGYASDSFFSGIVIRVSDDGDQYQIGLYLA